MALQPEPIDVLTAGSRVNFPVAKPLSKASLIASALLLCVSSHVASVVRADDTCLDPSCRETVGPDSSEPEDPRLLESAPESAPSGGETILEKPSDDKPPSNGTDDNRTPPTVGGRAG